jgi:SWI/SNF-related matrix-associated actin-dependent regulator of chromatin subfamily A3
MGLGKTLQYVPRCIPTNFRIISLLVADPKENDIVPLPVSPEASGTLIVSPLSLLSNWTSQISEHLYESTLRVLVFHGSTKKDAKIDLSEYDVVVTSYGALVTDYKSCGLEKNPGKSIPKTKRGLFGRMWRRIVLDEGHQIRNSRAKVSLAASQLTAVTRWSLTGSFPPFYSRVDAYV